MLKKLLILDDNLDFLDVLKRILQNFFEVYTFDDPVKLFLYLSYSEADMILMDHTVGKEQSPQILEKLSFLQIQQGLKKVPIILHSGHERIDEIAQSVSADGFIRKPCGIKELRKYLLNRFPNYSPTPSLIKEGNTVKTQIRQ